MKLELVLNSEVPDDIPLWEVSRYLASLGAVDPSFSRQQGRAYVSYWRGAP